MFFLRMWWGYTLSIVPRRAAQQIAVAENLTLVFIESK
jgi:hypothetical protein